MSFELLPLWYQYSVVFIFGLIIGSFLNVVIYRLNTGRSLSGHSHCMSCGKTLHWYELVPLVSYLLQRGRCRGCSSLVPARYFVCELLTGVVFLLTYQAIGDLFMVAISCVLFAVLIVTFFYDIDHLIIPDRMVIVTSVLAVGIVLAKTHEPMQLAMHAAAAIGAFSFFGGLWLVSKGRWIGLGDAKLAAPLAFILGPVGTFSFIVFSFWIGSVISLVVLGILRLLQRGQQYLRIHRFRFTMKSEVPFAPFIIASFLIVYLYAINAIELLQRVFI